MGSHDDADVTRLDTPAITDDADSPDWRELRDPPRRPRAEFEPANEVERGLLRAAANSDHDLFLQVLADAEVLLPVPGDVEYAMRPGRPGFPWPVRENDGTPVIPVFTSPERLGEVADLDGDFIRLPFTVALRYWPEDGRALAVNLGSPAGGTIQAEQLPGLATWADQRAARRMSEEFEPQNEVEHRLLDAARRGDTDAFFKVLLGAQVLVPAEEETPWGIAPDDPEFPWRPVAVHGRTSIQVFTSLKWMTEAIGSSRFVMPSLLEMVSAWPDAGWTLVLNPGTPIDATMPGDQVRALSGPSQPAADPEPAAPPRAEAVPPEEFEPGNRIDQELFEAAQADDSDTFLKVLLNANVLVPIPDEAPLEVTPLQREFRWDAALRDGSTVQVFTSLVRLREVLPESRFVYADFRELIAAWPHGEWTMFLNPGTRIGASLRGDQVQALSEWTVRIGLAQPRPDVPAQPRPDVPAQGRSEASAQPHPEASAPGLPGAPAQGHPEAPGQAHPGAPAAPHPEAPAQPHPGAAGQGLPGAPAPVPSGSPAQVGSEGAGQVRAEVAAPAPRHEVGAQPEPGAVLQEAAPRPAPRDEPDGDAAAQPAIMQKVVPHQHVGWYLEQGYDRVGGFVHPAADVAELQTPMQLYEALGLLYEASPFQPGDAGVHVIRWPGFCPDLYRVPFGGQTQEELESWGEAGWVLERAPFLGSGFAPGSAGSIREYKVDSVRLPYGAEMYYLWPDRSELFVAMYDPDRLAWLRPGVEGDRGAAQ